MRAAAMLDQVDRLPRSQCEFAPQDGDVQRGRRQHGLDMGRHVVGAFGVAAPSRAAARFTNFMTRALRSVKPRPEVGTVSSEYTIAVALTVEGALRDIA